MPKTNNFDLIRLAAALQVAINHTAANFNVDGWGAGLIAVTGLLPGVPVFFFISGFLISRSFEKNPVLGDFFLNRILRVYPGLTACFLLSVAAVWWVGYFDTITVADSKIGLWIAAQLSIVQFYNPDFMRQYGTGVLNGSMWTITVELQFYVLVPIVHALLRGRPSTRANGILLVLILIFLCVNQAYVHDAPHYSHEFWYKLAGVSFAPWFYMFLVGVAFQRNFAFLQRWLAGRFALVLAFYCFIAIAMGRPLNWNFGNTLGPALFLLICLVTFAAAFSCSTLSDKILAREDLSYGIYIYHMPVVNLLLVLGMGGRPLGFLAAIAATLVLAWLSWKWVEKPALGLKRHPVYQHDSASSASAGRVES